MRTPKILSVLALAVALIIPTAAPATAAPTAPASVSSVHLTMAKKILKKKPTKVTLKATSTTKIKLTGSYAGPAKTWVKLQAKKGNRWITLRTVRVSGKKVALTLTRVSLARYTKLRWVALGVAGAQVSIPASLKKNARPAVQAKKKTVKALTRTQIAKNTIQKWCPGVKIVWNAPRAYAGLADIANNTIRLNPSGVLGTGERLRFTMRHECAHFMQWKLVLNGQANSWQHGHSRLNTVYKSTIGLERSADAMAILMGSPTSSAQRYSPYYRGLNSTQMAAAKKMLAGKLP